MRRLFIATLCFAMLPFAALHAQETPAAEAEAQAKAPLATGNLSGTVTNADTGQPISGVIFTIPDLQLRETSNLDGLYFFKNIPVGSYKLVVLKGGFKTMVVSELEIEERKATPLALQLEPREPVTDDSGQVADSESGISEAESFDEDILTLDTIEVVASVVQNSNAGLISLRQRSAASVDALSSLDLSRFGVSDAAGAVSRMPGVTVKDGKYPVTRGLNERYSTTLLNGIVLPSPDPDRPAVPLDIFPAGVLDAVQIKKTFTPDLPGEASGGAIILNTKSFPEEPTFKVKIGTGFHQNATFDDDFLVDPESGFEDWYVNGTDNRQFSGVSQPLFFSERNQAPMASSFGLQYGNTFKLKNDRKLGVLFGVDWKRDYTHKETTFNRFQDYRFNYVFPQGVNGPNDPSLTSARLGVKRRGIVETSTVETQFAGLLSLSLELNENNKIGYNLFHTRNGSDKVDRGVNQREGDSTVDYFFDSALRYTQRSLTTNQIIGEHLLPGMEDMKITWRLANTLNSQIEPDIRRFAGAEQNSDGTGNVIFDNSAAFDPRRFRRETRQHTTSFGADFEIPTPFFDNEGGLIKGGVNIEDSDRNFDQLEWQTDPAVRFEADTLEGLVNSAQSGQFKETDLISDQLFIDANGARDIKAIYGLAEARLLKNLRLVGGIRLEDTVLEFNGGGRSNAVNLNDIRVTDPSAIDQKDALPSLTAIWEINDKMTLRGAWSRTIARPTFKEIAPYITLSLADFAVEAGNPGNMVVGVNSTPVIPDGFEEFRGLRISQIENWDLRWEYFFPGSGIFSVNAYHKRIESPIERVAILGGAATGSQDFNFFTFVNNNNEADVNGLEFELRRDLSFINKNWGAQFTIGGNFSLIDAEVGRSELELLALNGQFSPATYNQFPELIGNAVRSWAGNTRQLYDQPERILNAFVNYSNDKLGLDATLSLNQVSERLYSTGSSEVGPDLYVDDVHELNLVLSKRFGENLSLKFAAKNITNPDHTIFAQQQIELANFQGLDFDPPNDGIVGNFNDDTSLIYNTFRKGVSYSLSLSYDF